jgi:hypothetical protein
VVFLLDLVGWWVRNQSWKFAIDKMGVGKRRGFLKKSETVALERREKE